MLILSDTDRLRVNLDQLRQRILQPPRDGNRTAQRNVKLRKFLPGKPARGINRSARLTDNHIGNAGRFLDQLGHKSLAFAGGGSVSNGNDRYPVLFNQLFEHRLSLRSFFLRRRGIDHRRIQHLSGCVHHRDLTAGPVSGV